MTRYLIVDDHPLFRDALQRVIKQAHPEADIYEATSIEGALDVLAAHDSFDLAMFDLALPDASGFDGLIRVRAANPRLPIIIVSGFEEVELMHVAKSLGVAGYVPKSALRSDFGRALGEVMSGGVYFPDLDPSTNYVSDALVHDVLTRLRNLTPQQLAVTQLMREGLQNKQIAYRLGLAETTVKAHVSEILRKLRVSTRTNAVIEVSKIDFDSLRGLTGGQAHSAARERTR